MKITSNDNLDFVLPKDFHMKFIELEQRFNIYKIIYTYKTIRGNAKENHKYIIEKDSTEAKFSFLKYIKDSNENKPYRAISNVKILDVVLLGTVTK